MDAELHRANTLAPMRKVIGKISSQPARHQMFCSWYMTLKDIEKVGKNYKGRCQDIDGTFYHM